MDFQKVFWRELDIIAVHLIVVFGFHEKRSIDVRKELIRHFFKVIPESIRVFGMICNVILFNEFFKDGEVQISGNILSACGCIGIEINPMHLVVAAIKRYSGKRIVYGRSILNDLQKLIVQRIFF